MHSLWDYVQRMIQHLNWRQKEVVQEQKRGRAVTSHSGSLLRHDGGRPGDHTRNACRASELKPETSKVIP